MIAAISVSCEVEPITEGQSLDKSEYEPPPNGFGSTVLSAEAFIEVVKEANLDYYETSEEQLAILQTYLDNPVNSAVCPCGWCYMRIGCCGGHGHIIMKVCCPDDPQE